MTKALKDLAVKTSEYEKDGETKGRWLNVGSLMEADDGGQFLILNRTFNPAGLPNPDNRDTVLISMFDRQQEVPAVPPAKVELDDKIPF